SYKGNPFAKHIGLPIEQKHFDQWIALFEKAIDHHFKGPVAEEAKDRAHKMADLFIMKLKYYKESGTKPIL
ncbi:MAG: group III truncated hemoglobin, partial [Bacteroidota bacterium]